MEYLTLIYEVESARSQSRWENPGWKVPMDGLLLFPACTLPLAITTESFLLVQRLITHGKSDVAPKSPPMS